MSSGRIKEIDITGRRFGRLVALRNDGYGGHCFQLKWLCRCDCGREVSVFKNNLLSGRSTSCGCASVERMKRMNAMRYGHEVTMGQ